VVVVRRGRLGGVDTMITFRRTGKINKLS